MEASGNPVTVVYWPEPVGALWGGAYGNAKVMQGEPMAVLSDGTKHPL